MVLQPSDCINILYLRLFLASYYSEGTRAIFKNWSVSTILFCSVQKNDSACSKHEDCFRIFKRLVRYSENSKSDNFKKLSVLAAHS